MIVEAYEKIIDVPSYIEGYVNAEEFLECCKACENYDRKWSCPSFDFDPVTDYWKGYRSLKVVGKKMILGEEEKENWENLLDEVKDDLTQELFMEEEKYPGSVSLSAGSCRICGANNCSKAQNEPCRFPDKMRYSIEALGGNVGLTASKLLGIELQWIEEEKVPDYFVLIGGLLY